MAESMKVSGGATNDHAPIGHIGGPYKKVVSFPSAFRWPSEAVAGSGRVEMQRSISIQDMTLEEIRNLKSVPNDAVATLNIGTAEPGLVWKDLETDAEYEERQKRWKHQESVALEFNINAANEEIKRVEQTIKENKTHIERLVKDKESFVEKLNKVKGE